MQELFLPMYFTMQSERNKLFVVVVVVVVLWIMEIENSKKLQKLSATW